MRILEKRGIRTVLSTIVVIGIASAIAHAAVPDSTGVIHACYKAANGQLRIIDPSLGQSCGPSEVALQWNAAGPAGDNSTKTVSGAINPDGTSQLVTSQFTSSRISVGHYRLDFPAGVFDFIPNIVVMPIGKAYISGSIEFGVGGGAFAAEYFTVGIDSNQLQDTLVNFIATPFSH